MRIAFVVPYVPNLIRVRPYNLIRALAGRGHTVTVYTLTTSEADLADSERLAGPAISVTARPLPRWRPPWNCLEALPASLPLQAAYSWLPELAETLCEALRQGRHDVVHVEHLRGARYALAAKESGAGVPVVWDSVDSISYLFEQAAARAESARWRFLTRLDLERTRRFEALMRDRMDRTLITARMDQQAIEALPVTPGAGPHAPVEVVPNGVDLDYFTPGQANREPHSVVFSGKMSYHANVTAGLHLITEIMPAVWQAKPEAHLWVVGKDPAPELVAAAAKHPGRITVTGSVADMRPYIQRATLSIAPIVYGAGNQNKILEAMACETAVVAARQATTALSAREGEQLLIFDGPGQAAEQVVNLLSEPEMAARIGRAGRRYVEQHHRWDSIAGQVERIYAETIADSRRARGPAF